MLYELICIKTGRFWPVLDQRSGDNMAQVLGLKDYEVKRCPV